jgi:hypothetical protein
MPIIFENNNDVVVFALEKVISYARDIQYIFLAQSVWWISSILGLQKGLIAYIDDLQIRAEISPVQITAESKQLIQRQTVRATVDREISIEVSSPNVHPDRASQIQTSKDNYIKSEDSSVSSSEDDINNEIIQNCQEFLEQSQRDRKTIG